MSGKLGWEWMESQIVRLVTNFPLHKFQTFEDKTQNIFAIRAMSLGERTDVLDVQPLPPLPNDINITSLNIKPSDTLCYID